MKTKISILALLGVTALSASILGQQSYRGGIVYGPKAAFDIRAPEGWVLDNESGKNQGLPCVLYPKGSSWADAKTIMYAKIAGTKFEDVNAFVATAIKDMEKVHGKPKEKSRLAKRLTAAITSSTNIPQQRPTPNGSAWVMCNSHTPWLTLSSPRAIT